MLAFLFGNEMNIQTAIGYMKHGYRIRRASWVAGELLGGGPDWIYHSSWVGPAPSHGKMCKMSCSWVPRQNDLLADDWELILEDIATDYGTVKYEDKL